MQRRLFYIIWLSEEKPCFKFWQNTLYLSYKHTRTNSLLYKLRLNLVSLWKSLHSFSSYALIHLSHSYHICLHWLPFFILTIHSCLLYQCKKAVHLPVCIKIQSWMCRNELSFNSSPSPEYLYRPSALEGEEPKPPLTFKTLFGWAVSMWSDIYWDWWWVCVLGVYTCL